MYYFHHELPNVPAEQKKANSQDYISAEPHQTHGLAQLGTAQKDTMNKTSGICNWKANFHGLKNDLLSKTNDY